nr:unnamed protein product [Callosobruchus analis]
MPNKPNKCGMKIVMLCDIATKYVLNASPYLGKATNTNGAPLTSCRNMCCNRKTRRWPLCFFYNMMNIAAVNSYVIYNHNLVAIKKKPASRIKYMATLHEQLVMAWPETRRSIPTLSRNLKECICNIIGEKPSTTTKVEQKGKRSYCSICPSAKKMMTTTPCTSTLRRTSD